MKFAQLIEHNMRSIYLEKLHKKEDGDSSPKLVPRKSKLSIPLDQQSEILYSLLLLYLQVKDYQN